MNPSLFDAWSASHGPTTLWLILVWTLLLLLARKAARAEVPRLLILGSLIALHAGLGLAAAAGVDPVAPQGFRVGVFAVQLLAVVIWVGLFNALVLGIALGRFQREVPTLLRDLLTLVAVVVSALLLVAKQGLDVKALLPTGAVLTAVIGLAFQQTLGNLIGGLSLQLEKSVRVGDWVSLDNLYGRVSAVNWRTTTLETNDFETVVIPNSTLLAGKLLVRGRRDGHDSPWRRWVRFAVPIHSPAAEPMRLAVECLLQDPLPHVASKPVPDCVVVGIGDGSVHYALRYWLTDFNHDDATDSAVRLRLLYTLRRAGFELAMPTQDLVLHDGGPKALKEIAEERSAEKLEALRSMDLFAQLLPAELKSLAQDLTDQPFAPGEALCRQGDPAASLYLLRQGTVGIRVKVDGEEREVAQLKAGSFFGEMGLMTGEPRTATVLALSHVDCFCLGKDAFSRLLKNRPEVAETMAEKLSERRIGLEAAKEGLDQDAQARRQREHRGQLLARIREFFAKGA